MTLCDTMDCSLPGFYVHGIFQARILQWVAMPPSRGSSQPGDLTLISCFAGGFFYPLSHLGSLLDHCRYRKSCSKESWLKLRFLGFPGGSMVTIQLPFQETHTYNVPGSVMDAGVHWWMKQTAISAHIELTLWREKKIKMNKKENKKIKRITRKKNE